jgi:hypothetical protein
MHSSSCLLLLLLLRQVGHLEHLAKLYSRGDIPRCDWLDMLTFRVRTLEGERGVA